MVCPDGKARILKTFKETYADGPGIRYSIYLAGCTHYCKGCHNPESWNFNQGEPVTDTVIERIRLEIAANPLLSGITISGGDPFDSPDGLLEILEGLAPLQKNIWVYTGYTLEEILASGHESKLKALRYIDMLVDGEYKQELRDTTGFKGSTNQRFLKVKEILQADK